MRLSEGKLFWQEMPQDGNGSGGALQMVWFCDECSKDMPAAQHSGDSEFSPVLPKESKPRSLAQQRATHS
jgi:hypothetical protein